MRRTKLYISAALFIIITALKLLSPSLAGDIRQRLLPAIEHDTDYKAVMTEIGTTLSDGRAAISALGIFRTGETDPEAAQADTEDSPAVVQPTEPYRPKTVEALRDEMTAGVVLVDPTPQEDTQQSQAEAEADTEPAADPEQEAAVAAFLEAQAPYADYAIPANVSYSVPVLPFSYQSPVAGYTSSGFGYRLHPLQGEVKFHYGTDFAAWTGTDILAFADGTVLVAGESDSYGNYIIIDHGDGYETLYAHCSQLDVTSGESVQAGQRIGLVGATGQVTGPHLHFELMHDGTYLNPEFYLYKA